MDTVVQWNIRGFRSNYKELKLLLNRSQSAVVALQECRLGEGQVPPQGYTLLLPQAECSWAAHSDLCGSDHFPIFLTFTSNFSSNVNTTSFNFKKAEWNRYRDLCKLSLEDSVADIEQFTSKLLDAARSSIPFHKGMKNKTRVRWFTQECPDGVYYQFLRHLPESCLHTLVKLFNNIWTTGDIPPSWREASVVPIPKPGKDPYDPSNYRPIALMSCLCKTLERMVNDRLVHVFESRNLLSNVQCGFRKDHSTLDHLVRLETFIKKAFARKKQVLAVFFDLEKAYDTTWRTTPIKSLYAEAGEPSLEHRPIKLASNYVLKLKSLPRNPCHEIVFEAPLCDFSAVTKSEPNLVASTFEHIKNANINLNTIDNLNVQCPPPWEELNINVDISLTKQNKENTTEVAYQKEFFRIKEKFSNHYAVFTEGSKLEEKVVAAAYFPEHPDCSKATRLRDGACIQGNENVDKLAKAALNRASSSGKFICYSDLKPKINTYINSVWQKNWDAEGANKLHEVLPNLGEDLHRRGEGAGRKRETAMCRLRVGHTWLTQSYLLKNEDQPFCYACDSLYTVRHILIECPDFQDTRRKYFIVTDLYRLFREINPSRITFDAFGNEDVSTDDDYQEVQVSQPFVAGVLTKDLSGEMDHQSMADEATPGHSSYGSMESGHGMTTPLTVNDEI
ncbi:RNA-directed DNA polymerase from mobile element jockey [Plakobranchus ocellatus]|uniref:RNA-directed DNA polymerase from mobile element jockey n=1 Tax=Plakobranchus ocellatus TaxID=259542 RepID=A0AAV3ZJ68_9GAST|nr:RNA-directed DNA polymerase from mobile element jockey [Plakobranchus ocellatus]